MAANHRLAIAVALALAVVTSARAQSFSGAVTVGDSLSDSGNYAAAVGPIPDGNSFTTNPDPVYAQIVAAAFGYSQEPYSIYIAGTSGSDYAVGGACVRANSATFTCANAGSRFSLTNQLHDYLADPARAGRADPHALYMLWGGGNDIGTAALHPATAFENINLSADAFVGLIGDLQDAGARTIVVFNQYDGGLTPAQLGTTNQPVASAMTAAYNDRLNAGLANLADGVVPINVFALFDEFIADPALYGFTNVTDPACGGGTASLICGAPGSGNVYTYAPGTNLTYLFADGGHPTGGAHARLASVVLATLAAPGQVSMAGELPLQVYDDHRQAIGLRIFALQAPAPDTDGANVYARVQSTRQRFAVAADTRRLDNDQFTGTIGADGAFCDWLRLGGAISIGDGNGHSAGAGIDGSELLLSGYGVGHWGAGYVDAIVSLGRNSLDIDRRIALGGLVPRVEHGHTQASHRAVELGGGFGFGSDRLSHGPFASLSWQHVDVDGYAEHGVDSTAMNFQDFSRPSLIARLGYQLQSHGGRWQPFARVAYARESHHRATAVQAGSNTMNGHFTLDGFTPARDWFEADVGVNFAIGARADLSLGYRTRLGDDSQDVDAVNLDIDWRF